MQSQMDLMELRELMAQRLDLRHVRGAQGRLGGHPPKSRTRSIMVSSMGGNDVGDVVDGNVAFKTEDVGDNCRMTSGGEVFEGGVEYAGSMKVWEGGAENSCGMEVSGGGVEYLGGMEVSSVERPAAMKGPNPTFLFLTQGTLPALLRI